MSNKSSEIQVRGKGGISPDNVADLFRLADTLCKSGMVPDAYKNKPEAAMAAMQAGMEAGLQPMTSLMWIANIRGRPCIWGDGVKALVQASGLLKSYAETWEDDGEGGKKAVVTVERHGVDGAHRSEVTDKMVREAGWMSSPVWKSHTERMKMNRARTYAFRDIFSDVLLGLQVAEEQEDIEHVEERRKVGGNVEDFVAEAEGEAPPELPQSTEERDIIDHEPAPPAEEEAPAEERTPEDFLDEAKKEGEDPVQQPEPEQVPADEGGPEVDEAPPEPAESKSLGEEAAIFIEHNGCDAIAFKAAVMSRHSLDKASGGGLCKQYMGVHHPGVKFDQLDEATRKQAIEDVFTLTPEALVTPKGEF